ncbi:hypothetical protein KOW79_007247 [Hemibagrus wyckioides]|uniref:polynucleotide adenylyltransferase n=1 Tax=Hemibagrus wyckioides TaxID=337641 RepID=A0A9D3SRS2_9TELE|nr:hypothetical protein KOW79_007247 [Hemibagrus wyckioides]
MATAFRFRARREKKREIFKSFGSGAAQAGQRPRSSSIFLYLFSAEIRPNRGRRYTKTLLILIKTAGSYAPEFNSHACEFKVPLSILLTQNMMELKDDRRFHNLTQDQVDTLDQVLTEVIPIHGRGNFPTLKIKPKDIIHIVRDRLVSKNIKVRDVRLNGSTASHVLVKENGTSYKDLDIIFGVELSKQEDFQVIKEVVLGCLLDFLPQGVNKDKITALTMKEAYVQKMVKVFNEYDRWSLISLSNNSGKNVELKFVSSLRRQFEFSVDSFQIILDTMLESYLEAERREAAQIKEKELKASMITSTDLESVISHEQITSADVNEQQRKIESYLRNHFIGEEKSKYDYLMTLRRVVNESTVCLMGHERRQTLNMITILALKVLGEQNIIPNTNNVTCYYQPAPYMTDHNFSNYYIANGQSPIIYHPYPLHIHMQTGLV